MHAAQFAVSDIQVHTADELAVGTGVGHLANMAVRSFHRNGFWNTVVRVAAENGVDAVDA